MPLAVLDWPQLGLPLRSIRSGGWSCMAPTRKSPLSQLESCACPLLLYFVHSKVATGRLRVAEASSGPLSSKGQHVAQRLERADVKEQVSLDARALWS